MNPRLLAPHPSTNRVVQQSTGRQYDERQMWNNDFLRPPTQSVLMPHGPMSMAREGSTFGEPDLSSYSTSRRSSVNPPFTPGTGDDHPIPTGQPFVSPDDTEYPNGHFGGPIDPDENQWPLDCDQKVARSFMGLQFTTPIYPSNQPLSLTPGGLWLETIQEQHGGNPFSISSEANLQQRTTTPPERPGSDGLSNQRINALAGTWHMVEDSTWTRCNDGTPPRDASDAADLHFDSATSFTSAHLGNTASRMMSEPATKVDFTPVPCEQCARVYTGRWGMNNMQRHARLKHATQPRQYVCVVCRSVYNRSDALRNHEHSKHPALHHTSTARR